MVQVNLKSNTTKEEESQKNISLKSKSPLYKSILSNQKFSKWTTTDQTQLRGSSYYINCICDCGLKYWVLAYDLLRGASTQCKSCRTVQKNLVHGQNQHDNISYEYMLWSNLKQEKKLCSDWSRSFVQFYKDLGKKPNEKFNLQRRNSSYVHSISNSYWGSKKMIFFKIELGKKVHGWTLIDYDLENPGIRYLCECICGIKDYISQRNLLNGISKKCKSCAAPTHLKKHGKSRTSTYHSYSCMKDRCLRKKNKNYPHYGGRGIKICERWMQSFQNFLDDMGEKPPGFSLDRINNNGDYCPENCKWSTQKEQTANKRSITKMQNRIDELEKKISDMDKYGENLENMR